MLKLLKIVEIALKSQNCRKNGQIAFIGLLKEELQKIASKARFGLFRLLDAEKRKKLQELLPKG